MFNINVCKLIRLGGLAPPFCVLRNFFGNPPQKGWKNNLISIAFHLTNILMFSFLYQPHYKAITKYTFDKNLHKNEPSFFLPVFIWCSMIL